jgi:ADP-ribose pyrophosphatase
MRSKIAFECPKFVVKRFEQKLPNGNSETRWVVKFNPGYAIVPVVNGKKVLMIKEYKSSKKKYMFSLPSGGGKRGETPADGALRELEEETGYTAKSLHLVKKEKVLGPMIERDYYVFLASNLIRANGSRTSEKDEDILEVLEMPIPKVLSLGKDQILDSDKEFIKLAMGAYEKSLKSKDA